MKKNRRTLRTVLCALLVSIGLGNCTNDDYLIDGGTSTPYYDGTIWEYLNAEPQYSRYFTELVEVIKYAGMEDIFDKEDITFFAPTTQSIHSTMRYLSDYNYRIGGARVTDIHQIKPEVWKEYLSLYIVKGRYELKDIPQMDTTALAAYPGQAYRCYSGRPMNIGVDYGTANGVKYAGYRMLIYSYVNDVVSQDMVNAKIATCNLQPTNGIVHVIRFIDHAFGFQKDLFVQKAIDMGIGAAPEETSAAMTTVKSNSIIKLE